MNDILNIPQLIKQAHENAVDRNVYECSDCLGWGCEQCNNTGVSIKYAVYKKVLEENEEFLKSTPSKTFHKDSEQSEISDIIITLLAYCGEMGYDIEKAIVEKIEFNKTRPHKHGKEY